MDRVTIDIQGGQQTYIIANTVIIPSGAYWVRNLYEYREVRNPYGFSHFKQVQTGREIRFHQKDAFHFKENAENEFKTLLSND